MAHRDRQTHVHTHTHTHIHMLKHISYNIPSYLELSMVGARADLLMQ